MELALNEIKIQAKKLLKELPNNKALQQSLSKPLNSFALAEPNNVQLKHCLALVSYQLGFNNWRQAQSVLSGKEVPIAHIDMGTFFYPESCGAFINEWFNDYNQAEKALLEQPKIKWLLPYKKQFLVVERDYVEQLNINQALTTLWSEVERNMVKSYNSLAWDKLTAQVIKNRVKLY